MKYPFVLIQLVLAKIRFIAISYSTWEDVRGDMASLDVAPQIMGPSESPSICTTIPRTAERFFSFLVGRETAFDSD